MIAALVLGAALDADALFEKARKARTESGFPRYAVYAAVVSFVKNGAPGADTWDTVEDLRRRLVFSHGVSREEQANPTTPHGINFGVGVTGLSSGSSLLGANGPSGGPVSSAIVNPDRPSDPIGQVTLAVDQDFGLAIDAPRIGQTDDLSEVSASVRTLPRIGRTGTLARIYDVTLAGTEDANGATLEHLSLRPLRDPGTNRLRELWIDAKTSLPVRAIVAGIGNRAPADAVRWRVDFAQVEGGTYVARETALEPLDYGADGTLTGVTISFTELKPKNMLSPQESIGLASAVGLADP